MAQQRRVAKNSLRGGVLRVSFLFFPVCGASWSNLLNSLYDTKKQNTGLCPIMEYLCLIPHNQKGAVKKGGDT
jgi:hypothetical protein